MSGTNRVIGENLRILTQAMRDICQRSTLLEASNGLLSENQFTILSILHKKTDLKAQEFARILNISGAAISKNIDRLEALDMVARETVPDDRRTLSLKILPAGLALLKRHDDIFSRKIDKLLADFDASQKSQLLDYLQRLIRTTLSQEQDVDLICYQCGGHCGDVCVIETRVGNCTLKPSGG